MTAQCIFSAECIVDRERTPIELSPTLQDIMGGLLGGSFMIVTGPFKTGKSATCLDIAKRAQKAGYKVLYADIEHRLNRRDLLATAGLDLSEERFEILRSAPGNILHAEDFISTIRSKMESEEPLLVIADSVSQLCPRDLREGDIGDKYRDSTPALLSRFSKVLAPVLGVTNNVFIGITHIIANTSGMGYKTKLEASGNKIQYAMDFKIAASHSTAWEVSGNAVGIDVHWKCENSIVVPKGRQGIGKLRFGTEAAPAGIDDVAELLQLAVSTKVVTVKGSWYSFGEAKSQGEASFTSLLKGDAKLYAAVADRVRGCLS